MKTARLAVAAAALVMISACSNPEAEWQKATAENTEAGYQAFLKKYPQGEWSERAQAQLETMKDERDWENAQAADTVAAYDNYLLAHATGVHMGEARQRISEIETEAAWTAADATGTREALEEFLTRYAEAPQAELARAKLAELAPPTPPKPEPKAAQKSVAKANKSTPAIPRGEYQVQLGAFSALGKAQTEKARMEKQYHGLVGSLSVQKPTGADNLYRVKTVGMSEAAARSACEKLKGSGQDCVIVQR
jgi:hypothetical protein